MVLPSRRVSTLTPSTLAWRDRGRFLRIGGRSIFVIDSGPRDANTILFLHGFPTSSHDYRHVLPTLAVEHRVLTLDFLGYGLSDKPTDYSYSLFEQAELVCMLTRLLGIHRLKLVAHDMGTSVATELLAKRERGLLPFEVDALVLMNGSIHIELCSLTSSQKLLRTRLGPLFVKLSSRRSFGAQMRRISGKPLSDSDLDDMWCLMQHKDGLARMPELIRYVDERYRYWDRWVGALTRLDVPALVLWGTADTVAVMAIGEKLASEIPDARLVRLEAIGHYLMLEEPTRTLGALEDFLGTARPRQPMASQPALLR
jgi:pimeloyl-ACP methyl ester carboxylesterase